MSILAAVLLSFLALVPSLFAQGNKIDSKTIQLDPSVVEGRRPDSEEELDSRFDLEAAASTKLVKEKNELAKQHKAQLDKQEKIADKALKFQWGGNVQNPPLKKEIDQLTQSAESLEVSEKNFLLQKDVDRESRLEKGLPEGSFDIEPAH